VWVEYYANNGEQRRGRVIFHGSQQRFEVGDTIALQYNPDRPRSIYHGTMDGAIRGFRIDLIAGVGFILLGIAKFYFLWVLAFDPFEWVDKRHEQGLK